MICDTALLQAFGVINRTFMADVDDGFNLPLPIPDEDVGRMCIIDCSEGFHGSEDASDGLGDGRHGLPFRDVFHVPFSFCGEVLELPAEGEAGVDVFGEEGVD